MLRIGAAYDIAQGTPVVADLADRPTITLYEADDTSMAVEYVLTFNTNRDKVYSGGGKLVSYSGGGLQSATVASGANLNATQYQNGVFHEIETGSPNMQFTMFRQNTTRCRILFRNSASDPWKYAHTGLLTFVTTSQVARVKVAFAAPLAGRQVRLELANAPSFDGGTAAILTRIRVDTSYVSAAPAVRTNPLKVLFLGDSFTDGANATFKGDGYAPQSGWLLNWEVTASGIGGTGLIATSTGTQPNLQSRLDDALFQTFDAIVVAMGTNDTASSAGDITTATQAVVAGLKSRVPTAPQFWVTPWDLQAPSPLASNKAAVRDAIKAGTGQDGVYTFDPTGVVFTQSSSHPDTAGHLTLAEWLRDQVAALV
jgi:lysophospholipase L1-like esterase